MENLIIKPFFYKGKYFFYDTFSNRLLEITSDQFIELNQLKKIGLKTYIGLNKNTSPYNDILLLIEKGLIRNIDIKEIVHPLTEYAEYIVGRNINNLTLQVTRECNFKCRYCLFSDYNEIGRNHEKMEMPLDVATKSVNFLLNHSFDANTITIAFYGGEPLLNFDLISKVVKYSESLFCSKKIVFRMTINGSLLNEDIIDFIVKHNFIIAVSLDGSRSIQNKHRKFSENGNDTFNVVYKNIKKIKNKYPKYFQTNVFFIPVMFPDESYYEIKDFYKVNLDVPEDRIIFLEADLSGIDYTVSDIKTNANITDPSISEKKLFEDMTNKSKEKSKINKYWHHGGQCIPAVKSLFVDVYGNFYPCEKVIENKGLSIGNIADGLDKDKILQFMNIGKITGMECKSCWAMRFCEICVLHCYNVEKDQIDKEKKMVSCEKQKYKALAFFKHYIDTYDFPINRGDNFD